MELQETSMRTEVIKKINVGQILQAFQGRLIFILCKPLQDFKHNSHNI